jgi:hypothetical protein
MSYRYLVDVNNSNKIETLYDGDVVADAMAAFTKAILDEAEYVTLEALRAREVRP